MRVRWSWVLTVPFATTLVACSGAFGAGETDDAGASDATEANPMVQGLSGGDGGEAHDGTTIDDAGHHAPQHGAEVHHVPHAAPGDQRGDAERAFLTVLGVDDACPWDMPVTD